MNPPTKIRLFKPYDLEQRSQSNQKYENVQKILYYGESRCRAIVAAILKAPPSKVRLMQLALREELFVFMGYVGMMSSVNRVLDIPIFIRSLAEGFVFSPDEYFPVRFNTDLVEILEASARHGYGSVVPSYLFQWWTKEEEVKMMDIITWHRVTQCVPYHEKQLEEQGKTNPKITIVPNPHVNPISTHTKATVSGPTFSNLETGGGAALQHSNLDGALPTQPGKSGGAVSTQLPNIAPPISHLSAELVAAQAQNFSYLSTAQLKALLNSVNGYRRSYEAQVQHSIRRGLGFYILMERVMDKEMTTTEKAPSIPKKKGALAKKLRQKSEVLFEKGKNTKPTSSQWTYGEVLTREEVMELGKEEDQPDSETGSLSGEWSTPDSEFNISHNNVGPLDHCSDEAQRAPPPNTVASRAAILAHTGKINPKNPSDSNHWRSYLLAHPEEDNIGNNGERGDIDLAHCPVADMFSDAESDKSGGAVNDLDTCPVADLFSDPESNSLGGNVIVNTAPTSI
ncbi:hypothetical protein CPC08DRAFT_768534 [Agrocybe pediades]|nr:hypothetical protein CPC08DRAFT_768534 [Agrocybe pediades]